MSSLRELKLSENHLDGALDPLANMLNMTALDVSRNQFSGTVCALARMTNLISLAVGGNILTGNVSCLHSLTVLQDQLDISFNRLNGTLDVLPCFPKLRILNASRNSFSGLVVPYVTSSKLTQLVVVDISRNSFSDRIESFAPCANSMMSSTLTRLLLAGNAFVGSRFELDVTQTPMLVELDLSDNADLTGKLTQTSALEETMLLTAVGSTRFDCPTPPFPSTVIVTLSACRQEYEGLFALLGYVISGATVVGLIVFLTKGHQHPRFLRLLACSVWFAGFLMFLNDGRLLLEMVATVTGKTTNCDIVNQRDVFESFLPLRDISGLPGLKQGYIGPRGPFCFCGNDTSFSGQDLMDLRVDPPPIEQTFVEYMMVYTLWSVVDYKFLPFRQRAAFRDLCLRYPRCNLVPGSDSLVCGDRYDDAWSNMDDYGFLVCVVTLLVWRGVLEALKLAVIIASFVEGRLVGQDYAMPFLQSSPFLPLMGVFGVDWVGDVLRYQRTSKDHLRFFAVQGLLNVLPFVALQLYYAHTVQQTGLGNLSYVSMAFGLVSVPVIVLRACHALKQEHTTRATLVASIVAHSERSSASSADPDSVSNVDVELTIQSRDRSPTWSPFDQNSPTSTSTGATADSLSGSASDSTGAGCEGDSHQITQSVDEACAVVSYLHASRDVDSLEARFATSRVDEICLFPTGAMKPDSSDQV
jgi:hypothetical protein